MTGQAAFARTLRALDADSFRAYTLTLLFAGILFAGWIRWFFTPSVAYATPRAHNTAPSSTIEPGRVSPAAIVRRTLQE